MGITLWQYYIDLADRIGDKSRFEGIDGLADWKDKREGLRSDFFLSMGLDPLPDRCDLNVQDHGEFSGDGYRARKIAFQILPDCWATASVYYPDPLPEGKSPGVLNVCGHWHVGVWGYQQHGIMWARKGYVCLVLDTIEQHDNPGDHHGLYYGYRYDWISLGYTAAGGELWNSMRALDLLASLPEVDADRIGTTGNSGGGALSFFLAIADDRIQAAATSCGVAVPKFTIARRNLMGHCDCIYFHNPRQHDTAEFGAVIAPRPALFCYARDDALFTPEEYGFIVERMKKIYGLYDAEDRCELFDYPGPHGYKPESIQAIGKWFDKYVAREERPDVELGDRVHDEKTVSVFQGVPPSPNRLDLLPEMISCRGAVPLPNGMDDWDPIRRRVVDDLRSGALWPIVNSGESLTIEKVGDWELGPVLSSRRKAYRGEIAGADVWVTVFCRPEESDHLFVSPAGAGETAFEAMRRLTGYVDKHGLVAIEGRGAGFGSCAEQGHHLLRAGAMTGPTPTALTIHDLQLIVPWLLEQPYAKGKKLYLYGRGDAGVACIYHAVLNEQIAGVIAEDLPASHLRGGYILGILRTLDLAHAIGCVAPRPVALVNMPPVHDMIWTRRLYERLGIEDRLLRPSHSTQEAFDKMLALQECRP